MVCTTKWKYSPAELFPVMQLDKEDAECQQDEG